MAQDRCLFCKIAAKQFPAAIVAEDDHTIAFLDIHPRSPGHTMVISKTHSVTLLDLPDNEVGPLFSMVKHMDGVLTRKLSADGMTIGINQGEVSGQAVDHLHVHLMPRFHGDRGSSIHSVVNNPDKRSTEEIVELLKDE